MPIAVITLLLVQAAGPASPATRTSIAPLILTRERAESLSAEEVARLVLADFPHGEITETIVRSDPGLPGGPKPLDYISFTEGGTPSQGSVCRARSIVAVFTSLNGEVRARDPARTRTEPQRLFTVAASPTMAVVEGRATPAACAAVRRYARLPPDHAADGVAMVTALMARAAGERGGAAGSLHLAGCTDRTQSPDGPCDAERSLARVDWTRLFSVSRTDFPGEPVTWDVSVQSDRAFWHIVAKPAGEGWTVALSHEAPAPF